jgi:Na+-transporting NADH:ubiquinone oxidoreductase subunit NqrF
MQIEIKGKASGRSEFISYDDLDLTEVLLTFLRKKGITIASSCDGEGVCKKCAIQNDWLTCEMTLKEFLQRQPNGQITVGYL